MSESLRPLSLGEILDRTAQLYRRNFVPVLIRFYYDLRIRLEGYDIEWMMQQAGLAATANAAEAVVVEQTFMPLPIPATVKGS